MPMDDSLCLMRPTLPSLFLLCWIDTLQICTTTSHSSLAVRRLSFGPGSSLQVDARSCPSCHREAQGVDFKSCNINIIPLKVKKLNEWKIWGFHGLIAKWTFYLDVGVVHDQGWRHLQSEVIILPPVQHEGDTLLSNHLTQRHICRQQIHPLI